MNIQQPCHVIQTDWSALAMATKNGHEGVIRILVEHGADVTYQKKVHR